MDRCHWIQLCLMPIMSITSLWQVAEGQGHLSQVVRQDKWKRRGEVDKSSKIGAHLQVFYLLFNTVQKTSNNYLTKTEMAASLFLPNDQPLTGGVRVLGSFTSTYIPQENSNTFLPWSLGQDHIL